jgi:hypothetical protein
MGLATMNHQLDCLALKLLVVSFLYLLFFHGISHFTLRFRVRQIGGCSAFANSKISSRCAHLSPPAQTGTGTHFRRNTLAFSRALEKKLKAAAVPMSSANVTSGTANGDVAD